MVYLQNRVPVNSSSIPMRNNTVTYIRKERQGYVSILLPNSPTPVYEMANVTTMEILKDMDGERNLKDLFTRFSSKYYDIAPSRLEIDFSGVITKLWQCGIIVWKKGSNPFMEQYTRNLENGLTVRVAFEEDIDRLLGYVDNYEAKPEYFNFISDTLTPQLFSPLQLRYAFFNMTHIFFLIEDKEQVIGTVGVSTDKLPNVGEVSYLSLPESIIREVLVKITELSRSATPANLTKLRVYISKNENLSYQGFKKVLNERGFDFIALLKKEINKKDVEMYDYIFAD